MQNVALAYQDVAIEPFFDATQEMLSGAAPRFRLLVFNATTLRLAAGAGSEQAAVAISGRYRYRTTLIDRAHPGGVAGSYDVYVTASDNVFTGPPNDLALNNDTSFGLDIKPVGTTPTTALFRKVGEVDWSGTAITGLRQLVGDRDDTAMLSPTSDLAALTALRARGVVGQTAALIDWSAGADVLGSITPTGGLALTGLSAGITVASALGITASGAGGKTTLALTSTAANTGLTIGGDTTLYRDGAATLRTNASFKANGGIFAATGLAEQVYMGGGGGFPTIQFGSALDTNLSRVAAGVLKTDGSLEAATAASGTNTTQVATTAFVTSGFVRSPHEPLRTIRGVVTSAGGLQGGAGFTPSRLGVGTYNITFATAFATAPTFVASGASIGTNVVGMTSATGITIYVTNPAGTTVDEGFGFIVIGIG